MNGFSITTERDGARLRLALQGELDIAHVDAVIGAVDGETLEAVELLVIDLSELSFMDSSGLRALFVVDERGREHGDRVVFVRGPQAVQRVFEITALDQRLDMVSSLEEIDRAG